MRNWSVDDLLGSPLLEQGIGQHSRHFHQLFHQLRLRSRALNSTNRKSKLGHFDSLLGKRRHKIAKEQAHFLWLFHNLKHRKIKNLHGAEIFQDVLLQASLPASNLRQRCWPAPSWERSRPELRRVVQLVLLSLHGPGALLLSP